MKKLNKVKVNLKNHGIKEWFDNHLFKFLMMIILEICTITLPAQYPEIVIDDLQTIHVGTSNLVRSATGKIAVRQYKIGDLANGGIVFWVDESGEHGLVAAPSDQSTDAEWSANNLVWTGASGGNTPDGEALGIGSGQTNTELIISKSPVDFSGAKFCADLLLNGYGDWFMPSKGELFLMFKNLHQFGCTVDQIACDTSIGDFEEGFYWSSTEVDDKEAYALSYLEFAPGIWAQFLKSGPARMRAIRAF